MKFVNVFFYTKHLDTVAGFSDLFNQVDSHYVQLLSDVFSKDTIDLTSYQTSLSDDTNELKFGTKHQIFLYLLKNTLQNSINPNHPFAWVALDHLSVSIDLLYQSNKNSIFIHNSEEDGLFEANVPSSHIIDIGESDSLNSQLLESLTMLEDTTESNSQSGYEMSASFYDQTFIQYQHMKLHYTKSRYYSLWSIITDRLVNSNIKTILDVGCGGGQLALFIKDKGIPCYLGIDFSSIRISYAKQICPEYVFICCDAFKTVFFDVYDYDCVITLEFLEHIHQDLEIIKKIRAGTRFIGTVPNFPYIAHVRHFKTQEEVYDRYQHLFKTLKVTTHLRNQEGIKYFILDGVR